MALTAAGGSLSPLIAPAFASAPRLSASRRLNRIVRALLSHILRSSRQPQQQQQQQPPTTATPANASSSSSSSSGAVLAHAQFAATAAAASSSPPRLPRMLAASSATLLAAAGVCLAGVSFCPSSRIYLCFQSPLPHTSPASPLTAVFFLPLFCFLCRELR